MTATLLRVRNEGQLVALELVDHETGHAIAVAGYRVECEPQYIDVGDIHTCLAVPGPITVEVTTFGDQTLEFTSDEIRFELFDLDAPVFNVGGEAHAPERT